MIDNKHLEKQEYSAVTLTITVSSDSVGKAYNDLLGKYGKQAQIPGFRKGRVPQGILIRKFGESMKMEAAGDLVDAALKEALEDVEESPISQPILEELHPIVLEKPYKFTVKYDIFPEIILPEYQGIVVEVPQVAITKKHEDAELEAIREQNAVVVEKKDGSVADSSVVCMDYVEIDKNNDALEETRRKDFIFTVGVHPHPYEVEKDIIGMKAGEKKVITITDDENSNSSTEQCPMKLEVSITSVKERELPALDDELAQDVSEDLKTLDDLKKKVKNDLKEHANLKLKALKINAITDKLVEGAKIELPESMLTRDLENTWQDYVRQSGASEDVLIKALEENEKSKKQIWDDWRADAEKSIKTRLIYGRIAEEEKLNVTEDEITDEITLQANKNNNSAADLENMLGRQRFREYLRTGMMQKKIVNFLLGTATVKKGGKIDYNELMNA